MLRIDRRIIFVVIGLCTLLPLLYPVGLPIKISPEVRGVYDYIEKLPEGSVFLLSLDFDPASKPELHPQAIAILRHAFRQNLRVVAMTLWLTGTGMADQLVTQVAKEMGREKARIMCSWAGVPEARRSLSTWGKTSTPLSRAIITESRRRVSQFWTVCRISRMSAMRSASRLGTPVSRPGTCMARTNTNSS